MRLHAPKLARFARRVLRDFFSENNGLLLASAVAYNALLSLVPLAAVLVVILSKFFEKELLIESVVAEVGLIAPGATVMLAEILESFLESRELAGWIGVVVLLFFSSLAFRVLENAISIIFHRKSRLKKRGFWVLALMPYLFVALVAAGLIVVTVLTSFFDSTRMSLYGPGGSFALSRLGGVALRFAGWIGLTLLFTTLYVVMPATRISFRLALAGGVTAATLWEVMRYSLTWYFNHLSLVDVVYGSMGTTIIVLITMEVAALIVLLGAQVIADLQSSRRARVSWYEDPDEASPAADSE